MSEDGDILDDVSDAERKPRNDMYIAAAVAWTLQNAVTLGLFVYSVYSLSGYFDSGLGVMALVVQLLSARGLALLALVLLWLKRKSGWALTVVCSANAALKMTSPVWLMVTNPELNEGSGWWPQAALLCVFVMSGLTVVLCLTGGVRRFFEVTGRQLAWVIAGCVVFALATGALNGWLTARLSGHR